MADKAPDYIHLDISAHIFPLTDAAAFALLKIAGDEAQKVCKARGWPPELVPVIHQALLTDSVVKLQSALRELRKITAEYAEIIDAVQDADGKPQIFDHQRIREDGEQTDEHKLRAGLN